MDDGRRLLEALLAASDEQGHLVDVADAIGVLAAEDQWLFGVGQDLSGDHAVGNVGGGIVGHTDGHHPGVVGQGIGDRRGHAAVVAGEPATLAGERIQVVDAVQAGTKPNLASLQEYLALAVAAAEHHARWGLADGILDQPGWDAHPVAVHVRARAVEQLQGPRMCDLDPYAFQYFQCGLMDLFDLRAVDHREPGFERQLWGKHGPSPFAQWAPTTATRCRCPARLPVGR